MSSVSSIDGGSSLYSFVQSLSQTNQASATTATTAASTTDPASTMSSTSSTPRRVIITITARLRQPKQSFFTQLQSAVTTALQSAQQDGQDPNQAIESAISKIFANNNSAANTTNANNASSTTPSTTDPDAAQANTPASLTGSTDADAASGSSGLTAFFNTLQSFGVNPQQFHQDFLSAVQDAQNGNANPATAFQNIPPGTLVDTTG